MALERPKFSLLKKVNGVEIRDYAPYQVVTCDVSDVKDLNRASNFGFRYLFNYISGQNAASQKISMTVPVQQAPVGAGWKVSFVVPNEFMNAGAPLPTADRVQLERVEGGLVAALVYRGFWSSAQFETKKQALLQKLERAGYQPVGEVSSAVYNPPLTPPFLRHNEVLVRIKEVKANAK